MLSPATLLLATAALTAANTIPVSVGKDGLTFSPNVIRANVGDVIEFRFWPRNHSVVAGDFTNACRPAASNGFFSGFFPTQPNTVNDKVFQVTVSHTNPMPIYCSQNNGQHCKNGMVAVINPAGVGRLTLEAYTALARNAGNATSPQGGAFGGQVAPNEAATSSTASGSGGGGSGGGSTAPSSAPTGSSETTTQGATTTAVPTTTTVTTGGGAGAGGATTTTTTGRPSGTGNAAAGVGVPVAGLVAVAVGAFFV